MDLNSLNWAIKAFESLESNLNGLKGSAFHAKRAACFKHFKNIGLPPLNDEEWRYTNLSSLVSDQFQVADHKSNSEAELKSAAALFREDTNKVLILNGIIEDLQSRYPVGLKVFKLKDLLAGKIQLDSAQLRIVENSLINFDQTKLASYEALNSSFVKDVLVVLIDKNAKLPTLEIRHVVNSQLAKAIYCSKILVCAEVGSQIDIFESFHGIDQSYLYLPLMQLQISQNAHVNHISVQQHSINAYAVNSVSLEQARDSNYANHNYNFGGKVIRNNIKTVLAGEYCNATLNGLTLISDQQHIDNNTTIEHASPNSESRELYKGVYADQSKGVFSGTIIVRQDAQKTNAFQSNRALLLSDKATMDSMPQLKIWADDVKCTHGATIGQIDEEALFYLRSRGIPEITARAIMIKAFAAEVISQLPNRCSDSWVKDDLQALLDKVLG